MKSNLKNIKTYVQLARTASAAIFLLLFGNQFLVAQQEQMPLAPAVIHEDHQVAPADFKPMQVPEGPVYGSAEAGPLASDIPAADEFTVSDDVEAELWEAENAQHGLFTGIRQQIADMDLAKMLGSLAIVLGGYFGLIWLLRKLGPATSRGLPSEVVEVLGATPFGPKKHLQVIRLGSKLLLLINSPEGSQLIGEVSDPEEVDYLASLCSTKRRGRSGRASYRATGSSIEKPRRSSSTSPQQPPAADNLRDVLQQLQNVVRSQPKGSVFEA